MSKPTVYIRVDGSAQIGLGHFYRCLALAQMIDKIFNIIFVFRTIPDKVKININEDYDYTFHCISDEETFLDIISSHLDRTIVVLDGYYFETDYQKKIKRKGVPMISIDDIHRNHFMSDVVINHALGINKEDYSAEDYTRICLGSDYALLRPNFISLTSRDNSVDKLETAFICFGGADPNNLTVECLHVWESFESIKEAIVITGAGYENPELIGSGSPIDRLAISHYHDINDRLMTQLMRRSDFAIVPSSTILYEVMAARLPVITGYFVDNQRKVYQGFMETGAVLGIGELSTKNIHKGISKLTVRRSSEMVSVQENLIDGKSPDRILKLFQQLDRKATLNMHIRKVNKEDVKAIFDWANDPVTRKQSYSTNEISYEEHQSWFERKLNDEDCLFLMFLNNYTKIGIVRFDLENNHWIVSINIAPSQRGNGYAKKMLQKSYNYLREHDEKPVYAYIKQNNAVSTKVFERAGYEREKELTHKGSKSYLYIWR